MKDHDGKNNISGEINALLQGKKAKFLIFPWLV